MASTPPTSATSSTRGRRSTSRICACRPSSGVPTCTPTFASRVETTCPGARGTVPTATPRTTATSSSAVAAPRAHARRRHPASRAGTWREARLRALPATQLLRQELGEVRRAGPPARDDVVVRGEHLAVLDGRDRPERRPLGQALLALLAALRVGQHDEVGRGLDDVLRRQLRVAAARALGLVGDVLEAEGLVDAADEGVAGRRVIGLVELVVDLQA